MIVLDANILISAVLGRNVRDLLARYSDHVELVAPIDAFEEAREHLPEILQSQKLPEIPFMSFFAELPESVAVIERETYVRAELMSRRRLLRRDEDDWPILATALVLDCPIWTEDLDFFGCGVATWTSDRVEMFLAGPEAVPDAFPTVQ